MVDWYYIRDGKECGPIPARVLKRLADDGDLSRHDYVWQEGTDDWVRAGSVKGLFPPLQDDALDDESNGKAPPVPDPMPLAVIEPLALPATGQPQDRPLPVVLVAMHAAATGAVMLMQSASTSGAADIGSQVGAVGDLLGGLFGGALGDAGLPGGLTVPKPATSSVTWLVGLLAALTVPMIVFQLTVCYGLFTRQWWARRVTVWTYVGVVSIALLKFIFGLGAKLPLSIEALLAGAIVFYFTQPTVREYFGDAVPSRPLWRRYWPATQNADEDWDEA